MISISNLKWLIKSDFIDISLGIYGLIISVYPVPIYSITLFSFIILLAGLVRIFKPNIVSVWKGGIILISLSLLLSYLYTLMVALSSPNIIYRYTLSFILLIGVILSFLAIVSELVSH